MVITRNIFLALIFILVAALGAAAQVCGASEKPIFIYVRDGFALKNPRYELISVSPAAYPNDFDGKVAKFLSRTFFPGRPVNLSNFWVSQSFVISPAIIDPFLKTYRPGDYNPGTERRPIGKDQLAGPIKDGLLVFPTGELYSYPYLLKIFADNLEPVYILGAHLGGCYPLDRVILDQNNPRVVSERRPNHSFNE